MVRLALKVLAGLVGVLVCAVVGGVAWLYHAAMTPLPQDGREQPADLAFPFELVEFFNQRTPTFNVAIPPQHAAVVRLRTESLEAPLGLDEPMPRFSWQLEAPGRGVWQRAYRIQVSRAGQLVWDSNWTASDESHLVEYGGPPLTPHSAYEWRVKVRFNEDAETEWSSPAPWETGFMGEPWVARWIDPEGDIEPEQLQPAPYVRNTFYLDASPTSARLYISAQGLYEASINGQRVGTQVFAPGSTVYNKRIQYQAYDVTELLKSGDNAIGAILGDGWFRGSMGIDGDRNVFGERLGLIAELHVDFADGATRILATDDTWRATSEGPIRRGDMIRIEEFDARRAMPGWNEPGFDDSRWRSVSVSEQGTDMLVDTRGPLTYEAERFTPRVLQTPNGDTVLDFGQNLAGYVEFQVSGPAGHTVLIEHGETLDAEGNFTIDNLFIDRMREAMGDEWQLTQYTLSGEGRERYKPRFNVNGFRYVRLRNWPEPVEPENFSAIAVYSGMKQTGFFESSNPMLNRFVVNTLWSQKSNFLDVPTDCPQRERAGWSGDAQVYYPTSTLYMDVGPFFEKWLADMAASQLPDGRVRNVIPPAVPPGAPPTKYGGLYADGSAGWGDAAVIIPWQQYQHYGDERALARAWPMMKAWVDLQAAEARKTNIFRFYRRLGPNAAHQDYIWDTGFHWGEWLEPGRDLIPYMTTTILFGSNDIPTAYYAYSSGLLAQAAEVLGKMDAAQHYRELSSKAAEAYGAQFTDNEVIASNWQARYVRPVALGLLTGDAAQRVMSDLARMVEENDYRIGTGFLSTPFILHILSEYGYHDTAWKMMIQERSPGWMYPVTRGATTIWEHWDAIDYHGVPGESSLNHYAYGAASSWLFNKVAGIELGQAGDAYRNFLLRPLPVTGLDHARAQVHSPYGLIQSGWRRQADRIYYEFVVPPNSQATVILEAQGSRVVREGGNVLVDVDGVSDVRAADGLVRFSLGSGSYQFSVQAAATSPAEP